MKKPIRARYDNGRLITPEDIQIIVGFDIDASIREHKFIREDLKTKSEDLLVRQYCNYHNLNVKEVLSIISIHGKDENDYGDDIVEIWE